MMMISPANDNATHFDTPSRKTQSNAVQRRITEPSSSSGRWERTTIRIIDSLAKSPRHPVPIPDNLHFEYVGALPPGLRLEVGHDLLVVLDRDSHLGAVVILQHPLHQSAHAVGEAQGGDEAQLLKGGRLQRRDPEAGFVRVRRARVRSEVDS